jgi:hypothetical protein
VANALRGVKGQRPAEPAGPTGQEERQKSKTPVR